MSINHVFAGVAVAQLGEALAWYERLFGRPAAYLALAEAVTDEGATLLTADARLARAAGTYTSMRVVLAS